MVEWYLPELSVQCLPLLQTLPKLPPTHSVARRHQVLLGRAVGVTSITHTVCHYVEDNIITRHPHHYL